GGKPGAALRPRVLAIAAAGKRIFVTTPIRVAATGDIHAAEPLGNHIRRSFAAVAEDTDLVLLAGDRTTHGLPEQAAVLAEACRGLPTRILAVLGNHDQHSTRRVQILDPLAAAGAP